MGHAAVVSAAADRVEEVAGELRSAIPDHWRGRGADGYRTSAANLATGVGLYADRARGLARLVHQHEVEAAAIRAALAPGGTTAV